MAAADTARLIASLELNDRKFQQGVGRSLSGLGKLEGRLGALGAHAKRGAANAATNLTRVGLLAGAGLGVAVKKGIDSLVELENATTSVDGAIKAMGLTGQTSAAQIAQWANEIEASTQAAFDDKAITQAAATLIRYGKVSGANLRPSLQVLTDLAAKTGSIESASTKLAKALADPTKATRVLREVGVTLTKQQEKQIKIWVKNGKLARAQALILTEVGKATKNAARDSVGPYGDAQNMLNDSIEDATKLLAEGFLPVLTKVSGKLQSALADPATMEMIRSLGKDLAGALDSVIDIAGKIPWGAVKDAFTVGGKFAKDLLNAFTGMPAWVQTAVLTGWGLNKLTGGALGDIVGELGKGLIKGVLGMTAGVVNIRAGVVTGAGGSPIPGAASGAGGGVAGAAGAAAIGLTAATVSALAVGLGAAVVAGFITSGIIDEKGGLGPALKPVRDAGLGLGTNVTIKDATFSGTRFMGGKGGALIVEGTQGKLGPGTGKFTDDPKSGQERKTIAAKVEAAKAAQVEAIRQTGSTTGQNIRGTTSAVQSAQGAITAAIAANRPIVTTTVSVNVTAASVEKTITQSTNWGPRNGSSGGGGGNGALSKYD